MKKIGVFGSSFNPIHIGHLIISEQARIRLCLDKILFIPTANPYHKKVDLLDYNIRYEMTERTVEDNPFFEVSDIEKHLKTASYSFDIMKKLKSKIDAEIYFIIGSDSFINLHTWHRYEELIKIVNLVVFQRPGYKINLELIEKYRFLTKKQIIFYDDIQLFISSSDIRNNIKNNIYPKYLLRDETIKYIMENNLWR
ncbi:nicotinate-nucleotide adenylyltransferase [Helcococcus ovis]|uniref:nicotinate-nucleotide adenylyltransferase n=2 Tax=Helcococcus ovis TaxID=72026 RepID=UPI00106FA8FB|nr:nicotinate-nucleotide adenylyltransferase [Helcococcus ovis]TFF67049.1 nicotinate (nicotinamide) nucleotide adenylyltransferase [Helcococcus ovis]WNZ01817.1 nicotinate-nucleotide adenylyltransferase [Helcococcus ovis]